ncbi:hypothetical protein PAXRUDRAFT_822665 [Paxillus rubicundulus Ve08.2h10]|uniref:Unplaced genomic scaffold scaffold_35, whole genome shotgun sequence n=1 Tax=Paxillus rubicundulus Ve08.2h10 TaxID=930991 RepID=A0A0D0DLL6_9AGAM|nr:hypothetical protein PAXRUDRAFT_822665 [Paxillus rubicundulus Ve08.2h10]
MYVTSPINPDLLNAIDKRHDYNSKSCSPNEVQIRTYNFRAHWTAELPPTYFLNTCHPRSLALTARTRYVSTDTTMR